MSGDARQDKISSTKVKPVCAGAPVDRTSNALEREHYRPQLAHAKLMSVDGTQAQAASPASAGAETGKNRQGKAKAALAISTNSKVEAYIIAVLVKSPSYSTGWTGCCRVWAGRLVCRTSSIPIIR
jgi:hypothetical protein